VLVIYFGRDLTEGFTLILAVKMKVHKLLYFYWSLPTIEGISSARGLNDHRFHIQGEGKGQKQEVWQRRLYCRSPDRLPRAKKGSPRRLMCIAEYSQRTKIFVVFPTPPPLVKFSFFKSASESLIFLCRALEYSTQRFMDLKRSDIHFFAPSRIDSPFAWIFSRDLRQY